MTDINNALTHAIAVEPGKPVVLPLKAERIQLILLALDLGDRPNDVTNEQRAESGATPQSLDKRDDA